MLCVIYKGNFEIALKIPYAHIDRFDITYGNYVVLSKKLSVIEWIHWGSVTHVNISELEQHPDK